MCAFIHRIAGYLSEVKEHKEWLSTLIQKENFASKITGVPVGVTLAKVENVILSDGEHLNEITWNKDGKIEVIETSDNSWVFDTSESGWNWFGYIFCPFLGFLIPWGTIRTSGWITLGFIAKENL
jgi:hypothetical protein